MVNVQFWYWSQRPRSYRGHECMWHIVPWWYTRVKYGITLSKPTKMCPEHKLKQCQNPINIVLSSKVNVVSGSRMYTAHHLMVIIHVPNMVSQCQSKNITRRARICKDRRTNKQTHYYIHPKVQWPLKLCKDGITFKIICHLKLNFPFWLFIGWNNFFPLSD